MNTQSHFEYLGLKPNASLEDAKKRYKILIKKCHPDLYVDPGKKKKAEEILKKVNSSYEKVLEHIVKRQTKASADGWSEAVGTTTEKYQKYYSSENFWDKVSRYAISAGRDLIEKALQLYYVIQNPTTPLYVKAMCLGALGYFISPFDAIFDLTPFIGFLDDLTVLILATTLVSSHITDEVKAKASNKLDSFFKKQKLP